jgi:hypothetical protein
MMIVYDLADNLDALTSVFEYRSAISGREDRVRKKPAIYRGRFRNDGLNPGEEIFKGEHIGKIAPA